VNFHTFMANLKIEIKDGSGLLSGRALAKDGRDITKISNAKSAGSGSTSEWPVQPPAIANVGGINARQLDDIV